MSAKIPLQWKNGRPIPLMDTQLADFSGEEWKDIQNYEGDYQLSSFGRVKSLPRDVTTKSGYKFPVREKILKTSLKKVKEAIVVQVALMNHEEKRRVLLSVARLVYIHFVEWFEYEDRSVNVKRKDNDTLNLDYRNLYLEPAGVALQQPINQYDKDGRFIHRYNSIPDAAATVNCSVSMIKDALLKKFLQGKKYFWRRDPQLESIDITEWKNAKERPKKAKFRPVQKLTLDGEPLEIFESIKAATESLGFTSRNQRTNIFHACSNKNHTAFGFRWQYVDIPKNQPAAHEHTGTATGNNIVNKYNNPVNQYNINGVFVARYASASQAAKAVGAKSGAITTAIAAQDIMIKECYWRYGRPETFIDISAYALQRERYFNAHKRPLQQLTRDGTLLNTYQSVTAAANAIGVKNALLSRVCNSKRPVCMGFLWRFAE